MIVYTSITLNYLPKAKILAETLKKFHPDWAFHLLISDKIPENKTQAYEQELSQAYFDKVIWAEELPIENIQGWIFRHTVVEICTAVKGPYLQYLADQGHDKVMYIDPDIAIFNPLTPLEESLDEYGILLAPHLLDYTDNPQSIQDNEILGTLRHGTFNLGFLAVNSTLKDGRRFIDWWAARLMKYCYADFERGLFTDQKWVDLAPSFFENLLILRDPGYDVASWNLDCRELSFNEQGVLMVNQDFPLRFYHFTGYDSGAGANVIAALTAGGANPIANELWDWYIRQLDLSGHDALGKARSFYDTFDNGTRIEKEMRELYRESPDLQRIFPNPFDTDGGNGGYLAWWRKERPKQKTKPPIVSEPLPVVERISSTERLQAQVYRETLQNELDGRDGEYVPLLSQSLDAADALVKLIAFYLPQFHPFPENDEWWGKGFTEWTNVTRAVPQFPGHYQPHLPGELGFYDLRVEDVHFRQIELAKQFGLYGFAYHHYWFGGKRLMEMPVDRFLANKKMEFPFLLVWANENWTRRWDGLDDDILIAQDHSAESDYNFIKDLEPYLRDQRYIRIGDRPIIIVYRADILPKPKATAERWREYCVKNGLGEPYLIAAQTFGLYNPHMVGFDAAVQFPPHNDWHDADLMIQNSFDLANPGFSSLIFSYPKMVEFQEKELQTSPYKLFKTVFPAWDSEPRKPGRGTIYAGAKPSLYKRWLQSACDWTLKNHSEGERFLFVNAWNEWAEGTHLEPDRRFGYANLQATMEVLRNLSKKTENQSRKPRESEITPKPKKFSDEEWLNLMKRSINEPIIDGVKYPSFPSGELQVRFTGSSYEHVLEEASEFYILLKKTAKRYGKAINSDSIVHDFGCGWGRFLRFFMKDVALENIYGSDVMPLAIETCNDCDLPGNLDLLETNGTLSYPDNYFDTQMAYSVFTHLPEDVHLHWMHELARVAKPSGLVVVTLEPRNFLERIKNYKEEEHNIFLQGLVKFVPDIDNLIRNFDKGNFVYLPTGGGDNLTADVYGDAVVPKKFIEENWSEHFELIDYIANSREIWKQAILIVRKKNG